MANGFEVGEGDTGVPQDTAPVGASAPQGAGDAVLDVLGKRLDQMQSERVAPAQSAPMGLSPQQQFGASLLAALDPDLYQKIVVPTLQLQQNQRNMERMRVQDAREREDALFRTMLGIAQRRDELTLRTEQAAETERAHKENEDIRRTGQQIQVAEKDRLARERDQAKQTAEQSIKGVTSGTKTIIQSIDQLAGTAPAVEQPLLRALRANAVALDTQVAEFLASGQEAAPATAQQFETKYQQLAAQHFQAMFSGAQRAQSLANRMLTKPRTYMSGSTALAFGKEVVEPMNQLIQAKRIFDEHAGEWKTLFGTDKLGALKGKVLPKSLLDFRAFFSAFNVPFRQSQLGKQVTGVELAPGKPILPNDVGEYTVEEMQSAFDALMGLTAGYYRSQIQSLGAGGFNTQQYWQQYNSAVRPLLPDSVVQLLSAPPDAPMGSMGTFLRPDGMLIFKQPGDPSLYGWLPDTPEEGLWWANIASGTEGFSDDAVHRGLTLMFPDPETRDRIWAEFKGGQSGTDVQAR